MGADLDGIENWHALAWQARFSVSALARLAKTYQRALHRHFMRWFRTDPHAWLEFYRDKCAQEYLLGSRMPLKEVAWELGYSELAAFSRAFKRRHGVSPTEYRSGATC